MSPLLFGNTAGGYGAVGTAGCRGLALRSAPHMAGDVASPMAHRIALFRVEKDAVMKCRARVHSGGTRTGCAYGRTLCSHSRARWPAILPGWKRTSRHVMTTAWQGPGSPQSRLSASARCFRIIVLRRHIEGYLTCQWRRCCSRTRGIASFLGAAPGQRQLTSALNSSRFTSTIGDNTAPSSSFRLKLRRAIEV